MGGSDSEVIVAAVALVISVIALSATCMQVLQQYYASARGYSQCNFKVMGQWASTKARRFVWEELRYEVQFDSPVLFVCSPTNDRGPIPGEPIYFLDGTERSLEETWSVRDMDERKDYEKKSVRERIHTADNERASWFILMYACQRMEHEAREWQHLQYKELGPRQAESETTWPRPGLPEEPPSLAKHHSLTVALQKKRKSWDTMPTTVTKPYGTTAICHLIEMLAVLGVYWNEFDRIHDRYRAEGNGFIVLGERIADLGLMFSFRMSNQCQFKRNRVIPVDEIKELCFGFVPTIFRRVRDLRRLTPPIENAGDLRSLALSTRRDLSETLALIGCNNNTVRHVLDTTKRMSHLFPLSFELIGMLGQTLHINYSSFTYVPNPTPDRWDRASQSLSKLLTSYYEYLCADPPRTTVIFETLSRHAKKIALLQHRTKPSNRLYLLQALHFALDDADMILTAKPKPAANVDPPSPVPKEEQPQAKAGKAEKAERGLVNGPQPPQKEDSSGGIPLASPDDIEDDAPDSIELTKQEMRQEVVLDVLRGHIQEVIRLLNDREEKAADPWSLHVPGRATSPTGSWAPSRAGSRPPSRSQSRQPDFEDIDMASPDDRQQILMKVYFRVIRKRVVPHAADSTQGRRASVQLIHQPPIGAVGDGAVQVRQGRHGDADSTTGEARDDSDDLNSRTAEGDLEPVGLADHPVSHDDIWCTLVFRMVCWLMLHDFNKEDVQVNKSELVGSRLPVYIA